MQTTFLDGVWALVTDDDVARRVRSRNLRGMVDEFGKVYLHVDEFARLRREHNIATARDRVMRNHMNDEFRDANGIASRGDAWTLRFNAAVARELRVQFPGATDSELLRGGQ